VTAGEGGRAGRRRGPSLVGAYVSDYWEDDAKWYRGKVVAFDADTVRHVSSPAYSVFM